MSAWALVSLADEWWPRQVLPRSSPWPGTAQLVRLRDVASVFSVAAPLLSPLPLATPANVDPQSGAVTPTRVADDEGLVLGQDLELNDVLVPAHGMSPCVLVSDEMGGLAFRGFHVVRAAREFDPCWLWASLSSASGVEARCAAAIGSTTSSVTTSSLADVAIPTAPLDSSRRRTFAGLSPRPAVIEVEGAELRSAWALQDLSRTEIWTRARTPGEGQLGVSLSELGTLWSGRVDSREWYAAPAPDRTPVLTHRAVRGQHEAFRPFGSAGRATTDGTVVFTRTEPFRVMHAPARVLLSKELLALDVSNPRVAPALVRYFSGADGKEVLASGARGAIIRHLSLTTLRSVHVPRDLPAAPASAAMYLADLLEAVLRNVLAS